MRDNGILARCDCGAVCVQKNELKRFQKRHPALCSARALVTGTDRAFNQQLAAGVRSVKADDPDRSIRLVTFLGQE